MEDILRGYSVNGATWFYLSLLLIVAVYFRFARLFSLRNLDLALLLSLSPGLLLVQQAPRIGYLWLFTVTGLLLLRLFCDPVLVRRPTIEQNLNPPGLAFLGLSTFAFLMTIVVTDPPPQATVEIVGRAGDLLNREDTSNAGPKPEAGPASSLLAAPVLPITSAVAAGTAGAQSENENEILGARIVVILAHLAVIAGLIYIGMRHFGEFQVGLAMATLYLLLPCTAYDVGKFNHVLPSALIVWAFAAYRRPMIAGSLMGLACGTLFFPLFLLPLWATFYGRGSIRFVSALAIVGAVLLASLALTSANTHSFVQQTIGSVEWGRLFFHGEADGFWSLYDPAYRIPVVVAYLILLVVLTVWPMKKNFEHLLSHSTALVAATQFWYPQEGGVYLLWFLPLVLLVVFRPRLAHLVPPEWTKAEVAQPAATPPPRHEFAMTAGAAGPDRHFFR